MVPRRAVYVVERMQEGEPMDIAKFKRIAFLLKYRGGTIFTQSGKYMILFVPLFPVWTAAP
jgi:hypothetical protein